MRFFRAVSACLLYFSIKICRMLIFTFLNLEPVFISTFILSFHAILIHCLIRCLSSCFLQTLFSFQLRIFLFTCRRSVCAFPNLFFHSSSTFTHIFLFDRTHYPLYPDRFMHIFLFIIRVCINSMSNHTYPFTH